MDKTKVAVFIDADNVSAASVRSVFEVACRIGDPIVRRAYGTPQSFQGASGWQVAQREYGISSRPQISNLSGKNAADIALVIDAMECLYRSPCEAICIVSNDSDYTALAKKIRESGKEVFGIGGPKAPISFRSACTQYIVLPKTPKQKSEPQSETHCPRCGSTLKVSWTKSRKRCQSCPSCGGMSAKLGLLKSSVAEESLAAIKASAAERQSPGCVCPDCGSQMGLVRVAVGKHAVEIDVCAKCSTVWYDKDEFESLSQNDGLLEASVSAGKAFRREVATMLAADLREGRINPKDIGSLKALIKHLYHAPNPDVTTIIDTLRCQKVIQISKTGLLTVLAQGE